MFNSININIIEAKYEEDVKCLIEMKLDIKERFIKTRQAKMADAVFACFLGKSIFKQRNHCDILFVDEDRRTAYAYF